MMAAMDYARRRQAMVEQQLRARGIHDARVLEAFAVVPRERFVAEAQAPYAYDDRPLPIAAGQTISQPYVVAFMVTALALSGSERVLEVGTGSGYAAAILSRIAAYVYTVERHLELVESARRRFTELGYTNIEVLHGDGTLGWPEHAPYDAIAVAAGSPEVPDPLRQQLAIGGRLVIPMGTDPQQQMLVRVTRLDADTYRREDLLPVRFVPLIGSAGWSEEV